MKKLRCKKRLFLCCIITLIAIGLLVTGFFIPPTGQIDGSVIQGTGLLLGFNVFFLLWHGLDTGWGASIRHGETEITFTQHNDEDLA